MALLQHRVCGAVNRARLSRRGAAVTIDSGILLAWLEPCWSRGVLMTTPSPSPEDLAAHLAAVVQSSDDAIVSKTLDGIITSWNPSAEKLFGYTAAEVIGQPITLIIPPERLAEEEAVLRRLRAGETIEHFETVRLTKGGQRIPISLTVSPVRTASGGIIGASKIVRDL